MKQLDPKAVWLFFINYMIGSLFLLVFGGVWILIPLIGGATAVIGGWGFEFVLASAILIAAVSILLCIAFQFFWAKLVYHYYRYELTEDGFRKELGVITKKYVTIPYDRIQNVDIYRGIIARMLGLSDLNIQTAGVGSGGTGKMGIYSEGRLPGLSFEVAEALRDELIRRAKTAKNQGL